jgi:hypothetical protein
MRNTTLIKLLDDLRAETRSSLNPAHNAQVRDTQVKMLQRVQERLWGDFNWPFLRVERQIPGQAGQRYYETPADLDVDRLERVEFFTDGCWRLLAYGIGGNDYADWNSDLDERSWPIYRWKFHDGIELEMWPILDRNADVTTRDGYLKYTGIRKLKPLVADTDRADLDDRLIVMFAAAEMLAATGAKDAQFKLDQANTIYAKLRGEQSPTRQFRMFGVGEQPRPRGIFITQYRPPGT